MNTLSGQPFNAYMQEYKAQIKRGIIKQAYKGLMDYFMRMRADFENKYPSYSVSGNIYYGFMDMTYFAISTEQLKRLKLKIAVVFVHEPFRFEVWLAGQNKQVQTKFWKLFKESGWDKYHLSSTTKRTDSIMDHILVDNPDFSDLERLTIQIEKSTNIFIEDVCNFLLSKHN